MKIFCTVVLNEKSKLSCIKHSPDLVIYARVEPDFNLTDFESKFKIEHAYHSNTKLLWFVHESVSKDLKSVTQNFESVFKYKNIDLKEAVIKDLYWSMMDDYALKFCIQKYNSAENKIIEYSNSNSLKTFISIVKKIVNKKFNFPTIDLPKNEILNSELIYFRINVLAAVEIYGNLFAEIGKEKIASFQTIYTSSQLNKKCNTFFNKNISTIIQNKIYKTLSLTKAIKAIFDTNNIKFINALINSIAKQKNSVDNYETLFKSNIKKIVLNAGENEAEGIIACLVAKKHNAKVFNYMNGYKAKDPHNITTGFYCWFMPDVATKNLITSYCNIDSIRLPIVGHLIHEQSKKHTYAGNLDLLNDKLKNKTIIAFCSSRIFDDEKKEVLNYLDKLTTKDKSILVLIRKHPSEKTIFNITNPNIIVLPANTPELTQTTLYDLFLTAHFVISFSSTVSLQANWFNLPSVNFDFSKETRLTYIDNKNIFHVSNISLLNNLIDDFLIKKTRNITSKDVFLPTSQLMIDELMNC